MSFEVEQKFRMSDLPSFEAKLARRGAKLSPECTQVDCYYSHPTRDFAVTDEALRIRQVGEANYLTYKGPKVDKTTKTRREIEVAMGHGAETAAKLASLLEALGFSRVAVVRKQRRTAQVGEVEVALDDVEELGTFVELEMAAEESSVDAAKSSLAALAAELGLHENERRSYMELLVEQSQAAAARR